jgi:hypothetical protein
MCYFGHAYFRAASLQIGRNCKNLQNIKKSKTFKTLIKSKKCEKLKKNIKLKTLKIEYLNNRKRKKSSNKNTK